MMITLYADRVSPSEIEKMDFQSLRYWSECSKAINKQKRIAHDAEIARIGR